MPTTVQGEKPSLGKADDGWMLGDAEPAGFSARRRRCGNISCHQRFALYETVRESS